jgi:iron complex outermembrane receptor protein
MRIVQFLTGCSTVCLAAMAAPVFGQAVPSPEATSSSIDGREIVVTASKRDENIRQTALPISALTGDQLAAANANSLSDYIVRIPGVVFNDYQPGVSEVIIRGIAATTYHEQGQTTIGYYMNEVPLVEPGWPIGIPDVDTFDIERVEVLRGPQGTLFGASTLGGLVNYIVKTADTGKFEAAAQGLIGSTKNASGGLNYGIKGMVNVPIVENVLAARLVALQRYDAGYLDNEGASVDEEGSNDFRTRGLRGSIVFTPGETTRISFLSTYQESDLDDQTYVDLDNLYVRNTPRREFQTTDFWLNSLRLDQNFDFGTLSVIGSHTKKNNQTVFVYPGYGGLTGVTDGPDAPYSLNTASATIKTFEARLASAGDTRFKWLVGVSYLRARKNAPDRIYQNGGGAFIDANPALFPGLTSAQLVEPDALYGYEATTLNEDFGIFGELSYKITPELELTVGGRYFDVKNSATINNAAGATFPGFVATAGVLSQAQKEDGFTPKATIAFRPTSDLTFYATYSEGFRVGGPNPNAAILSFIPASYESDKTINYEIGGKTSLFGGNLIFDATVFHIDWKNIQARLFTPAPFFYSYVTNAGAAGITGVEVSTALKLGRVVTLSSNITYQDAKLSTFLPDTFAPGGGYAKGTTLPGSSEWSIANNVTFDLQDVSGRPTIELAHRWLSKAPVAFGSTFTRGGFSLFDARASISINDGIRLMGFVNNLFDKAGILNAPFAVDFTGARLGSITRPRTFGLRVDVTY